MFSREQGIIVVKSRVGQNAELFSVARLLVALMSLPPPLSEGHGARFMSILQERDSLAEAFFGIDRAELDFVFDHLNQRHFPPIARVAETLSLLASRPVGSTVRLLLRLRSRTGATASLPDARVAR